MRITRNSEKVLASEKKSLYHGYRELKDQRMALLMAKDNCERLLGINRNAWAHHRPQPTTK